MAIIKIQQTATVFIAKYTWKASRTIHALHKRQQRYAKTSYKRPLKLKTMCYIHALYCNISHPIQIHTYPYTYPLKKMYMNMNSQTLQLCLLHKIDSSKVLKYYISCTCGFVYSSLGAKCTKTTSRSNFSFSHKLAKSCPHILALV